MLVDQGIRAFTRMPLKLPDMRPQIKKGVVRLTCTSLFHYKLTTARVFLITTA